MATEIVYYKPQVGRATKDVLRELTPADQEYIKKVMLCYQALALVDTRPMFNAWFNTANDRLPKQPQKNNERNSPQSFCEGIIDKLNQAPNRRDLSPKQCDGIEAVSEMISELYDPGSAPVIQFKNKLTQVSNPPALAQFGQLFTK